MKIKEGLDISSDDFYYDLIHGGYLIPKEIIEDEKDIEAVNKAISVLSDFENSCEEQIEDFIR